MLDTLEELEQKFKKIWQQKVPMEELTVLAVHPNPRQALVLTNRALYLLSKRLWRVEFMRCSRTELGEISRRGNQLVLIVRENELVVEFSPAKEYLLSPVLERIQQNNNPG